MKNLIRICILIIVAAVYSCDDPYKDETFAVYDMQPISSYLSTRPDDFSEWIKVMKYADMYNAVNQATAKLTLFAPTNQAMEAFYQEKKVSSVEELGKVYVRQLVQYHLVNDTITLEEFSKGGELEDKTLSNDILEVTFNADDSSEGVSAASSSTIRWCPMAAATAISASSFPPVIALISARTRTVPPA